MIHLIHILLVLALSFVKLLRPLLGTFHAFMIEISYTPPSYADFYSGSCAKAYRPSINNFEYQRVPADKNFTHTHTLTYQIGYPHQQVKLQSLAQANVRLGLVSQLLAS